MSVGVVIVAAGRGERLGGSMPKQWLDLGGVSMLRRSVLIFDSHPAVSELVVVVPGDRVGDAAAVVGTTSRPVRVVAGGERRQDSVRHGVRALAGSADVVLIHDAARPFAAHDLVDRVISGARDAGVAVPAMPVTDTVKRVAADGRVQETMPREQLRLAQTPQGFQRPVLDAVLALSESALEATDEATLAERAGHAVLVVPGDDENVKITTAADLAAARAKLAGAVRVGTGYDLHRLGADRPLVLAGVTVSESRGPVAHSDGDVLSHAIIDAMLGAVAAGDIGRHFPNTDPRWKDAPGLDLLAGALAIVRERGFDVLQADATIVLERPKLSPHIGAMQDALCTVLGIGAGQVSVKAKTNEGVDAVGRGEAIAAHAVAVLGPRR